MEELVLSMDLLLVPMLFLYFLCLHSSKICVHANVFVFCHAHL